MTRTTKHKAGSGLLLAAGLAPLFLPQPSLWLGLLSLVLLSGSLILCLRVND